MKLSPNKIIRLLMIPLSFLSLILFQNLKVSTNQKVTVSKSSLNPKKLNQGFAGYNTRSDLAPSFAQTDACKAEYDFRNLSTMNGLNTKWRTYSTRLRIEYVRSVVGSDKDTRVTIQPDLGGLTPVEWLVQTSNIVTNPSYKMVNRLMLNLDPANFFSKTSSISDDSDWRKYIELSFKNRRDLRTEVDDTKGETISEKQFLESVQGTIDQNLISVSQRNDLLLDFLIALETGPGGICDSNIEGRLINRRIPFFLHQRKYLYDGSGKGDENQFVKDMRKFINKVLTYDKKNGTSVAKWIAGVRLGENMSPDPANWKQSVLYIAEKINAKTGNFLKQREFIANGPLMGSDYKINENKINEISIDDTSIIKRNDPNSFIKKISLQTHSFGIGYKFMTYDEGMPAHMQKFNCPSDSTRSCDSTLTEDWKSVLEQKGFDDLKKYINHHYLSHPLHSNVVWVGDAGDAMRSLLAVDAITVDKKKIASYEALASYKAIADKFKFGPNSTRDKNGLKTINKNFNGMLFMMPNASEMDFEEPVTNVLHRDIGKYLVYSQGNGTFEMDGELYICNLENRPRSGKKTPLDWIPANSNPKLKNESTIDIWKKWPEIPTLTSKPLKDSDLCRE